MITTKTFELLDQLAEIEKGSGSRTAKLDILKNNREDLQEYMDIAFNPYRVFKIVQIPEKTIPGPLFHTTLEKLASYLEQQKGGTNESKMIVAKFIEHADVEYDHSTAGKWCRDAILKNVKMGVDIKTLNKAGYDIPMFELLLASPNKDNSLDGISYPAIIEPKLDGCRAVYFPDTGVFLGRNGREVPNEQIYKHIKINTNKYVLDGEFFSYSRKFNEIVGYFTSDNRELPEDIKFVVFNAIPIEDWHKQRSNMHYNEQLIILQDIASISQNVEVVPHYVVNDEKEMMIKYQQFLSDGFEGGMARNVDSNYSWDRVKVKDGILTKLKPFDFADCIIIGAYEGKDRNIGRLGGFVIDFNGVQVECGGGFSDSMRINFWADRDKMIGKLCRVKYSEITEDKSLRFPIWDNLRDEK